MLEIRIVCTYDALSFAEALMRLLEAEQREVRLYYGRQSTHMLDDAKMTPCAVLMVWSTSALSQHYMTEWAQDIPAARRIEVMLTTSAPKLERSGPVIDFANWRGERGGRAWSNLTDRLRSVERTLFPPKGPPKQAFMAMSLASVAAVSGALVVRMDADNAVIAPLPDNTEMVAEMQLSSDGLGGATEVIEPPSAEEQWPQLTALVRQSIDAGPAPMLLEAKLQPLPALRNATLADRLRDINPIRLASLDLRGSTRAAAASEPVQDRPAVRFMTDFE